MRCKKGDDVEHIDYCTCGVIELDDRGEPILFYNKKNQIFLLEHGPQVFLPNQELKNDIRNLNLTNKLIRKCKSLGREQRNRYIELGKYCEECNDTDLIDFSDDESLDKKENVVISSTKEPEINIEPTKENNSEVQSQKNTKKAPAKKKPKDSKENEENKSPIVETEKKKRTYTKKTKNTESENK